MKTKSKFKVIWKPKHLSKRKVNEITRDLKHKETYYLDELLDELDDEFDIQHIWPL